MKKNLLYLCTALSTFALTSAQTLQTEQFTTLTSGNIGTNITGASVGQDNWFTFASNGTAPTTSTDAGNANFQATVTGNPSNGLIIAGPNGDKGSRYMWKDGLPTAWTARTSGNDIIEIEVDINPGLASTSRNTFGVYIFDGTGARVLAGFTVRAATKELFLVAYSTPGANPVGNYTYNLAAAPGIQLPAGTWSRIGLSFDTVTGQALLKGPGIGPAGVFVDGSSPGTDPGEVDIVSFSGHTVALPNSTSASMTFDNLVVRASATDTLLGTSSFNSTAATFANVYPNPVTDFASINLADAQINAITVMDINGRVVKTGNANELSTAKIDLSDLTAGIYLMAIDTDKGISTEKIVKK